MSYLKLKKIKRFCSNIGLFVATVGLAFSIGSIVTNANASKAKEEFVDDYKRMRIEKTEDHQEIESILDMSDKQVFEEAEKDSDRSTQGKLNEIERKDDIHRGHQAGMLISLGLMSAAMAGTLATKMKMADIENERNY